MSDAALPRQVQHGGEREQAEQLRTAPERRGADAQPLAGACAARAPTLPGAHDQCGAPLGTRLVERSPRLLEDASWVDAAWAFPQRILGAV